MRVWCRRRWWCCVVGDARWRAVRSFVRWVGAIGQAPCLLGGGQRRRGRTVCLMIVPFGCLSSLISRLRVVWTSQSAAPRRAGRLESVFSATSCGKSAGHSSSTVRAETREWLESFQPTRCGGAREADSTPLSRTRPTSRHSSYRHLSPFLHRECDASRSRGTGR